MLKSHSIFKNKDGATAIEFALLILPFSLTVFVILEIALIFFVDSALDSSLHKSARSVRVGTAQNPGSPWNLAKFKSDLCSHMAYYFDCTNSLKVSSRVITDISNVSYIDPVDESGSLAVAETFNPGSSDDYVLIQAFIPWKPILPVYGFVSAQLNDGTYILGAAVLFKNEPF